MSDYNISGSSSSMGRRCRNCINCGACTGQEIPTMKPSSLSYGDNAGINYVRARSYRAQVGASAAQGYSAGGGGSGNYSSSKSSYSTSSSAKSGGKYK